MLCRELLTKIVEPLNPLTSLRDAALLLERSQVKLVPVCNGQGRVVGTVTQDQVAGALAEGRVPSTSVADVMTVNIVSCRPDQDVTAAEGLLHKHGLKSVVCIDMDEHAVGIFSLRHDPSVDANES